jgi:hypothetical protein
VITRIPSTLFPPLPQGSSQRAPVNCRSLRLWRCAAMARLQHSALQMGVLSTIPWHGTVCGARHSLWSLCTRVHVHVGLSSSGACTCPATGELLGLPLALHEELLRRKVSPRCDTGVRAADRTLQNTSHTISAPRLIYPITIPSLDSYTKCHAPNSLYSTLRLFLAMENRLFPTTALENEHSHIRTIFSVMLLLGETTQYFL